MVAGGRAPATPPEPESIARHPGRGARARGVRRHLQPPLGGVECFREGARSGGVASLNPRLPTLFRPGTSHSGPLRAQRPCASLSAVRYPPNMCVPARPVCLSPAFSKWHSHPGCDCHRSQAGSLCHFPTSTPNEQFPPPKHRRLEKSQSQLVLAPFSPALSPPWRAARPPPHGFYSIRLVPSGPKLRLLCRAIISGVALPSGSATTKGGSSSSSPAPSRRAL